MRLHLLTVDGAQQTGDTWVIAPSVPLGSFDPTLMMPMAGEEVELHLPDGRVKTARIASFGVDVWKDSEGNFYLNSDPSKPSLTLTIICPSDVREVPAGTDIWLSNARYSSGSEAQ